MSELLILVNERDEELGFMDKLAAHQQGLLHRAFSVFIFNSAGKMLLQQRAMGKYHSGGLWSNACCSHPRPGESIANAAVRRLNEEMGIICTMEEIFSFVYKAALDNSLTEHEYDHVLIGICDDEPQANSSEVAGWRYIAKNELLAEIEQNPEKFTEWFKMCMNDRVEELYKNITSAINPTA